ncbi:MAG TPA: hypothetical protein VGC76_08855 [Pyrinomonadaceae bacterium]|jgi:hypothetical protein
MAANLNKINLRPEKRGNILVPILVLWGLVVILGLSFVWYENGLGESLKSFYLLPWAFLAGIVVLAPSAYLFYKKQFDPFHPLVFAAWTYVFPAFVFGGVIISFDWVKPYFMSFIEDPEYNLPLTLVYIAAGFLGLTVGFALPIGKYLAGKLEPRLPKWQWDPSQVWIAGIVLLAAGIGINILGFVQGIMGFQRVTEISMFDGLLYFLIILLSEGNILLWFAIFGAKKKTGIYYIVLTILILFLPLRMALLGSRSSLLISMYPIAMAFQYSGRRLRWQYSLIFGFLLAIAVCIGVIYGTTFRNIKGSEARMNAGDYIGQIGATLDYLSNEDPVIIIQNNAQSLADRVENLSSLGVVVANYEKLAPYEASYGLENNIVNDALTSFIPRFVWSDKPPTSDARAYSDLYFNYGENSFAISPFGDLLRNFGPFGVPLGMLVLGIYLRLIYALLIDTPHPALWKKVAYFPLLTVVSYEAFFATIFPSVIRTLFILAISLFIVNLIVKSRGRQTQ